MDPKWRCHAFQQVDPNNLPPEMANDPLLMKELQARGMGGEGQGLVKVKRTPKGSEGNRHAFQHNGQTVYEWDQTLDEVNIWIKPPPGVLAQHLDIEITCTKLRIGIKENPPFLNESLGGEVIVKESFWSMQDGELTINLQKMRKAETWPTALRGHGQLDPLAKQEDQKRLMLERFGEENPGFDFSGAEFNGQIPDARNFMGGVKYT